MKEVILRAFMVAAVLCATNLALAQADTTARGASQVPATPLVLQPANMVNYDNYKLAAGDSITILVYQEEDMTTQAHLTKEGTVTVPLIGLTKISGLTCTEAADKIRDALIAQQFFVGPRVTVVLSAASQKSFVILGQISRPGTYSFSSQDSVTLVQAIAMAGGLTRIANDKKVIIVRGEEGGGKEEFRENAHDMMEKSTTQQFEIKNGDIITVPETFF